LTPVAYGSGLIAALAHGYSMEKFLDESGEDLNQSMVWFRERIEQKR
jgi:hypothetical protein